MNESEGPSNVIKCDVQDRDDMDVDQLDEVVTA